MLCYITTVARSSHRHKKTVSKDTNVRMSKKPKVNIISL